MTQTITALFDKPQEAEAAKGKLVAAGIPQSAIRVVQGSQTTTHTSGSYDRERDEGGFWGSLKDFFLPEEDRYAYSEGLSRGGTMVTVSVEQGQADRAYDILEENGSVDLDDREATWRKEGWSGYTSTGSSAGGATASTGAVRDKTGAETAGGASSTGTGTATGASTSSAGGTAAYASSEHGATSGGTDKEYIPVVEERLNVGKRVADHGRVRVRSYAVEKPVEEQVNLREESVHVDRRPVDRAPTAGDQSLFEEKTIEAREHREEAVVSKDARVTEEIGIHKDANQRTETVQDKVRRTEVEVEDERGNVSRTGTTGTGGANDPRK